MNKRDGTLPAPTLTATFLPRIGNKAVVILYALGNWLGWWAVGAIAIAPVLDMARWPRGWRCW